MELFPAQPDLSLQISPPNSKPSSGWRRSSEDEMDLGFWKRALDSRNSSISSSTMAKPADNSCFELSLSNYPRVSEPNSNHFNLIQNSNSNLIHSFHQHNNQLFHHQMHQGLSPELGFLRPIRGIPVYQNPAAAAAASSFPFAQHSLDTTSTNSTIPSSTSTTTTTTATTSNPFSPHQGLMRSRILSRFPAKRSMRAPRMRWTTTLHARFVHAVELLGGHESKALHYKIIHQLNSCFFLN